MRIEEREVSRAEAYLDSPEFSLSAWSEFWRIQLRGEHALKPLLLGVAEHGFAHVADGFGRGGEAHRFGG